MGGTRNNPMYGSQRRSLVIQCTLQMSDGSKIKRCERSSGVLSCNHKSHVGVIVITHTPQSAVKYNVPTYRSSPLYPCI